MAELAAPVETSGGREARASGGWSPGLYGAGLLILGLVLEQVDGRARRGEPRVSDLVLAMAAVLASAPVLWQAGSGFLARPSRNVTEQLVGLAILAAMATGDFVSAALVPLLLQLGHSLEERCVLGATAAIDGLRELCHRDAKVLRNGREVDVAPEELVSGDVVMIRPGDVVPVDGVVRSGRANMDQAPITGESDPTEVGEGCEVFAGTVNLDGFLRVEASRIGRSTLLGRVMDSLREVERAKTPVVRFLERLARTYLPAVLASACVVLLVTGDPARFIALLIVACPCALILSVPAVMVAAMSTATRSSILVKNAAFLEELNGLDTLILDKTGTLTEGKQSVEAIHTQPGVSKDELLRWASAAGRGSRHHASRAVVAEAEARDVVAPPAAEIREVHGCGVVAKVGKSLVRVGRASWLRELGVEVRPDAAAGSVFIARDREWLGSVSLRDRPRGDAREALSAMRALGFTRVILLTGDRRDVAERVGADLGTDEVYAEVQPEGKLEVVSSERRAGRRVLMVGDGINDALALSGADVGVALGSDVSEVVLGGADIALLRQDLRLLPLLVELSGRAREVLVQNIALGMGFSVLMLLLAGVGWVGPLTGAVLHHGGAVFVILNSARLLKIRPSFAWGDSTERVFDPLGTSPAKSPPTS